MEESVFQRWISATEANAYVQLFRTHPQWGLFWSPEKIASDPPVRVEFEHVAVFATVREAQAISLAQIQLEQAARDRAPVF